MKSAGIAAVLKFRDVSNSCFTFKRRYNFCYLQLARCARRDAAKYKIIKAATNGGRAGELWPLRRNSLALTRLQLLTAPLHILYPFPFRRFLRLRQPNFRAPVSDIAVSGEARRD